MKESVIETYLKMKVKEEGGHCLKLRFIGRIGCPDRLVLLKDRHFLIELKRPGAKARGSQSRIHALLRWAGLEVHVINSFEGVEWAVCKQ